MYKLKDAVRERVRVNGMISCNKTGKPFKKLLDFKELNVLISPAVYI